MDRHGLRLAEVYAGHVTTRVLAPLEARVHLVDEHAQDRKELDDGELDLVAARVESLDGVVDCKSGERSGYGIAVTSRRHYSWCSNVIYVYMFICLV